MGHEVGVGIEKVLVAAAADEGFRAALLQGDRAEVVQVLGLSSSELAMLLAIPREQLEASIAAVDISPGNMARRSFLRSVAVSAAVVVTVDGAAGCSDDGDKPPKPDLPMATGIRPDLTMPGLKDAGPPSDTARAQVDTVTLPDMQSKKDHLGSFGVRPGG